MSTTATSPLPGKRGPGAARSESGTGLATSAKPVTWKTPVMLALLALSTTLGLLAFRRLHWL